ncbi:soluble NSF attachment protein [Zopfochytrium polystomum]|nr:soluble NSF attachment protein [Zopfochytrium polystomum]KAI9345515.1 soluble NSF attachment protein [Zopfochytrium polystomum]
MSEREGHALMKEAEKAASYKGWFGANKTDEAADLYSRAANAFKLAKKWKEAGDAYVSQANLLLKAGEKDEAASAYSNASKAYKKTSPQDSVHCLEQAIGLLIDRGRFSIAASNQKQVAEIYENDIQDIGKACAAYEKAAEWYQAEDSNAQADACLIKVATFAAQLERFDDAVQTFETVASHCVDNKLTKWNMKDYFLKAGLCLLCIGDSVRTRTSIDRYRNMDVSFETTRECKFLLSLVDAIDNADVQAFTDAVVDYDRLTKLDSWKTSLLLRVKKSIGEEDLT